MEPELSTVMDDGAWLIRRKKEKLAISDRFVSAS